MAKILAGIGAVLAVLCLVWGHVLSIVGFVLVLVAFKWISEIGRDETIFRNVLIAVNVSVMGAVTEEVRQDSRAPAYVLHGVNENPETSQSTSGPQAGR